MRTPDRTPGVPWPTFTYRDFLHGRLGAKTDVDALLASGAFVDAHGIAIDGAQPCPQSTVLWFHRARRPETPVPFDLVILHADQRIVVVDKPHFLATTPRGAHVTESVVARLRTAGFPDAAPAHRLDRLTAGVLLLARERRWRAAYTGIFASGAARKTYEAIGRHDPSLALPRTVVGRLVKERGALQAGLVDGDPNSQTVVELVDTNAGLARYRLTPTTGKTHQLRVHLASLGVPIVGDPLYPTVRDLAPDDHRTPLALVARRLQFIDPVDGAPREFTSGVRLDWPSAPLLAD